MANNHQSIKSKTCTNYIKKYQKQYQTISQSVGSSNRFCAVGTLVAPCCECRSFFRIRKCRKPPRIQIGIGWDRWVTPVTPLASWGYLGVRLL